MNLLPAVTVNYTAIVAAAVASFVVGWLWYGPLFGKTWMKLTGMKEMGKKDDMMQSMVIMFVGTLITAWVLSAFLQLTGSMTLSAALPVALWVWLGFQAPEAAGVVLWEGKSWNLFFLNAAQKLVNLLAIAAVLTYLK